MELLVLVLQQKWGIFPGSLFCKTVDVGKIDDSIDNKVKSENSN
jgi:hypothetical protein